MFSYPDQKRNSLIFIWRIAALHTIAFFIAGIFSLSVMNYSEAFGRDILGEFMLPVDHWKVAMGLGLQPIRGLIIGVVLLPFKEIILAEKGWVKLAVLMFGLSYLSTIGPAIGSFDGYIFTKIPIRDHLLGIPETLLYIFLFSSLLSVWYRYPTRGMNFMISIFLGFILLMSLLGYLDSLGWIRNE